MWLVPYHLHLETSSDLKHSRFFGVYPPRLRLLGCRSRHLRVGKAAAQHQQTIESQKGQKHHVDPREDRVWQGRDQGWSDSLGGWQHLFLQDCFKGIRQQNVYIYIYYIYDIYISDNQLIQVINWSQRTWRN